MRTSARPPVKASRVRCTLGRIASWDAARRVAACGRARWNRCRRSASSRYSARATAFSTLSDAPSTPALKLGVVVRADAGEIRHLLATQPRHPSNIAVEHVQAGLLRRHPRPARHQELPDLPAAVHAPKRSSRASLRGAYSTPFPAKGDLAWRP